jgi:eukaryotic-like serine/threonine-protein kinase
MSLSARPHSLGPYKIRDTLGHGSGGEVFRAWDPRLHREVAVKVLRQRVEPDPERLQRFIAEARAASALNHPNIVTIFDAAIDGSMPFIVSELIDGKTLREEMVGPFPLKRTLDLATQIADGLAAAHEAGLVHRDLKPENIMVTRSGRAKIVDFGLVRIRGLQMIPDIAKPERQHARTETELGLRAGTVPYMSPEQARGAPSDRYSDQFSFGLVLYEMIAGRPAFRRETPAATMAAIIEDDAPMAPIATRTPPPLRWIVERCLAKDPHDRYAATSDLHRDLKTLRDRGTELTRPADLEFSRRTRGRRGLTVAGLMIVAATTSLALLVGQPSGVDEAALTFRPLATNIGFEGFPAWSPDGQTIAYAAEVDGVLQIFTRRVAAPESVAQVTYAAYDCKYPFWSHDGKRIYYTSLAKQHDGIWSIGASSGTPQIAVENATRGAITPDGRTLAFLRDEQPGDIVGAATLWLSTPAQQPWTKGGLEAAARRYGGLGGLQFVEGALAFSPDGRRLGLSVVPRSIGLEAAHRGWQFWVIPIPQGAPRRHLARWSDVAPRVGTFAWLPDNRHVVLGVPSLVSPGSDLWLADLSRDRVWPLTRSPDDEYDPTISPTGDRIAFTRGASDFDIVEMPLDGGTVRHLVETARNESDPAWSADATMLAFVTDRAGGDEIWLRRREGDRWVERPLVTQAHFGDDRTIMLSSPSFSPDGKRIAYQRDAQKPIWPLRIWTSLVAGGAPVPLLPESHEGYQSAPSWSPNGEWIAYTEWKDKQWTLAKVRVGSGEEPLVLRTDGAPSAVPRWSPRDDWITWATAEGIVLVSPDGQREKRLPDIRWLDHAWTADARAIIGITATEDLRLSVIRLDVAAGPNSQPQVIADLGMSLPVNDPVRGMSLRHDGKAIATSMIRLRGDLWTLHGLDRRRSRWWPFRSP